MRVPWALFFLCGDGSRRKNGKSNEKERCVSVGIAANWGIWCCKICVVLTDFCFFAGNLSGSLPEVLGSPQLPCWTQALFVWFPTQLFLCLSQILGLRLKKTAKYKRSVSHVFNAGRLICYHHLFVAVLVFFSPPL